MARWLLLLCAIGCTRQNGEALCVPGEQRSCPCLGGGSGIQACQADRSYGSCGCSPDGNDGGNREGGSQGADGGVGDAGNGDGGQKGDGGEGQDLSVGDLATADLAFGGRDLLMPDLRGVDLREPADLATLSTIVCASEVCSGGDVCCLNGSTSVGSCTNACANSPFACDGPEDCPPGDSCCVDVLSASGSLSGGASCAPSCTGSYDSSAGGVHEQSQLCHSDGDCGGISGAVLGLGPFAFSSCCHSSTTSPYQVCIPGALAGTVGFVCP
jgi:hypothetical protein